MTQTSPTRTELLTLQAQIGLAEQGAELLRSKREALMQEFLKELRKFTVARQAMRRSVRQAVQHLMRAMSVDGPEAVNRIKGQWPTAGGGIGQRLVDGVDAWPRVPEHQPLSRLAR